MSKQKTIHGVFGDKHKDYINRATSATISVAEGAVRAGKTIDNIAAFSALIAKGAPDRIHLATGSTIANAKLNIGDGNGFGLEHIFRGRCRWSKYRGNEALVITINRRDYVVIFAGGAKADSFKKIRGNSYGMWIATEINLHHEDTIREAFNRQLAAKRRRIFWDLNPSAPGSWIYAKYIDRLEEQFGNAYNYEHFTIRDNATITPERLREIEAQYELGSIWYRRDILGQRCAAEGLVYPMFSEAEHVIDDIPWQAIQRGTWYISIDYGTANPCSMGLWVIYNGMAYRVKESYYDSREHMNAQKTDEEHYAALEALAGDRKIDKVIVDPSAASLKQTIRRHGRYDVWDANNDVIDGVRTTATMLKAGRLKFHRSCEACINEFGLYMWDSDAAEDAVIKANDHCLTGDTFIDTAAGQVPIKELVGKTGKVWSYNVKTRRKELKPFHDARQTQERAQIFKVTLEGGRVIRCTGDHWIMTDSGWMQAEFLWEKDCIVDVLGGVRPVRAKVKSVEQDGEEPVYNMEVDGNHNFSVNGGLIVHNCMDETRYFVYTVLRRYVR